MTESSSSSSPASVSSAKSTGAPRAPSQPYRHGKGWAIRRSYKGYSLFLSGYRSAAGASRAMRQKQQDIDDQGADAGPLAFAGVIGSRGGIGALPAPDEPRQASAESGHDAGQDDAQQRACAEHHTRRPRRLIAWEVMQGRIGDRQDGHEAQPGAEDAAPRPCPGRSQADENIAREQADQAAPIAEHEPKGRQGNQQGDVNRQGGDALDQRPCRAGGRPSLGRRFHAPTLPQRGFMGKPQPAPRPGQAAISG